MVNKYHKRQCKDCGTEVIDVRDELTGATLPVEARYQTVDGMVLRPARDARMNPLAARADLYLPHFPRCDGPLKDEWDIEPGQQYEEECEDTPAPTEGQDPVQDPEDPEMPLDNQRAGEGPH